MTRSAKHVLTKRERAAEKQRARLKAEQEAAIQAQLARVQQLPMRMLTFKIRGALGLWRR